ncbi:MAG: GNAT family N-acetyltransferase [Acidimicrobiales bacterium]
MDLELRPIVDEELESFIRADSSAFGTAPHTDALADVAGWLDLSRSRAVFDDGRVVGASATMAFELTLPGLTTVPAAGVSWVGVVATHRRRGLLRAMMAALLDDAAARGEPVAILTASESHIYGRFGFGPASSRLAWEIERRHAALVSPAEESGALELIEGGAAAEALPPLFDAARRDQPGDLDRKPAWWSMHLRERPPPAGPRRTRWHVLHRSADGPDGYATYHLDASWEHGVPTSRLVVHEVVTRTMAAEAALWRYLIDMDLTEVVEAANRPVDEPLRWILAEPRRLRVTGLRDELWVRLLDIPVALAARRYAVDGELVIEVAGAGRYLVAGGPDGAACRSVTTSPELSISLEDLGALYLGGVALSTLARVGRVIEHRSGALARADAMFVSHPAPFSRTSF